jgi:hypothetical protein
VKSRLNCLKWRLISHCIFGSFNSKISSKCSESHLNSLVKFMHLIITYYSLNYRELHPIFILEFCSLNSDISLKCSDLHLTVLVVFMNHIITYCSLVCRQFSWVFSAHLIVILALNVVTCT